MIFRKGDGGTAAGSAEGTLPLQTRLGWGLGSMPITILNLSSNVLLLRYMTDSLGIAASVAALIFAGAKVWDAVSDPLMGAFSDRVSTPWGRRLPWLALGGLLCVVAVVALYTTPDLSGTPLLIYLSAMLLVFAMAGRRTPMGKEERLHHRRGALWRRAFFLVVCRTR